MSAVPLLKRQNAFCYPQNRAINRLCDEFQSLSLNRSRSLEKEEILAYFKTIFIRIFLQHFASDLKEIVRRQCRACSIDMAGKEWARRAAVGHTCHEFGGLKKAYDWYGGMGAELFEHGSRQQVKADFLEFIEEEEMGSFADELLVKFMANDQPFKHIWSLPEWRKEFEFNIRWNSDGSIEWNKETQGLVLAAFFWGWCIPLIFYGIMIQKYGAKYFMFGGIFISTIGTFLTPLAAKDFTLLIVTRFFMGLAASVGPPAAQKLWASWAPATERTVLLGMNYVGAEAGIIIAFGVSGQICARSGWETVFYVYGAVGVVWCIGWLFLVAETPAKHPRISKTEKDYIQASVQKAPLKLNIREIPWKSIFTSVPFWALLVAHVCSNLGAYLILTELPSYMSEVLRFDVKSNGLYSALPYLALVTMVPLVTVIADFLKRKLLSTGNVRKIMMSLALCGSGSFLIATGYLACDQTTLAVIFLTISAGISACKNAGFIVNHADIAPKYSAITSGISTQVAGMNGFIAPILTSFLTKDQTIDQWRTVFWIIGAAMFSGAIFYAIFGSGEVQEWAKEKEDDEKPTRF